ncbi:hypothetical protein CUC43_34350 (plasmid) [Bacillus thuringiensis LM1212]|uniref:hypothetical protein n=1 Tax=Bacillus cereus group TaxID=86661 RepID=UPI0004211A99|nr:MULTISPECIES: hypothetical protein [Bacillus cereus group]AXY11618.1 hypothetical protein CUC43_34265 [Bacillus thuringiensis LM1212]AXY11634.1 hypothetical protein CUC43_34350 [Bacillus thuringiensis LM1212]QDF27471.1 hypothetical protein FJR70_32610 [Bacillus tropicus]QUG99359.1 hypothetical protein HCM98_31615 [Bacillus tropicus]
MASKKTLEVIDLPIDISTPQATLQTRKTWLDAWKERKVDSEDMRTFNYALQGVSKDHELIQSEEETKIKWYRAETQREQLVHTKEENRKQKERIEQLELIIDELEEKK